jgi:rubrerythrin
MDKGIQVKCRHCGRMANSAEFILDPIYGMLVCEACIKDRKKGVASQILAKKKEEAPKEPVKPKPAGWDREDEVLAKDYASKMRSTVTAAKIDDDHVMYKCKHCGYEFKYSISRQMPARCPYCSADINKFMVN